MRLIGVAVLILLPILVILIVWRRIKWKEKARDKFFWEVQKVIVAEGWQPLGWGKYSRGMGRGFKFDLSTNPRFARGFTLRLAAWSPTMHEFELGKGRPVPEEFKAFAPLLERWDSAGKLHTECWAAGVVEGPPLVEDIRGLGELAQLPISKT